MENIQIKRTKRGYDWVFKGNKLITVTGNEDMINSIKHAIMLRKNELLQELYADKGCTAGYYTNDTLNEYTRTIVKESLEDSVRGVHEVRDASIELMDDENSIIIQSITVTRNDGGVFRIDS